MAMTTASLAWTKINWTWRTTRSWRRTSRRWGKRYTITRALLIIFEVHRMARRAHRVQRRPWIIRRIPLVRNCITILIQIIDSAHRCHIRKCTKTSRHPRSRLRRTPWCSRLIRKITTLMFRLLSQTKKPWRSSTSIKWTAMRTTTVSMTDRRESRISTRREDITKNTRGAPPGSNTLLTTLWRAPSTMFKAAGIIVLDWGRSTEPAALWWSETRKALCRSQIHDHARGPTGSAQRMISSFSKRSLQGKIRDQECRSWSRQSRSLRIRRGNRSSSSKYWIGGLIKMQSKQARSRFKIFLMSAKLATDRSL